MNRATCLSPLLLAMLSLSAPLRAHPPGMQHGAPGAMHPGMHEGMFASMDADHDGRISAQEHASAAATMFTGADADHDGYLTAAEMQAMHARHAGHGTMPQHMPMGAAGQPAMPMPHAAGQQAMPHAPGLHAGMGMQDHLKAMDADGDGRISAAEHAAGAARMFATLDADHDGFLSRGEFDAGHAGMMQGTPQAAPAASHP